MTYTTKTLAKHWDCCVDSIRRLIKNKQLKAFKIGTDWRIPEHEVKRYEENIVNE
ncbi:helix-turn-helix domain-containing protein [Mycoplasmatota bacterium]|nr:helix-turn-helix domain-containing protein [Mycoplasmatota bacterium]